MDAPWSDEKTLRTKDRLQRLSKEILDFEKYIQPTKEEQLNRDTLLYQVSQLLESIWPNNCTLTAFGSSVTGLTFPSSDIDINIDFEEIPLKDKIEVLKRVRRESNKIKIFNSSRTSLVAHAKVPVLMAIDHNNVAMDITVQNECFSSDRTAAWIKEYPALKPLFMVLKQAIGNFRVSKYPAFEPLSAKTAGLASFSLICLIVSYLQVVLSKDCKPTDPDYYGVVLVGFLQYYSTFESNKYAIGLKDEGNHYEKDNCPIPLETKPGKITIVDPDVPGANISRSTLKFDTIQFMFGKAYELLAKRITSSSKTDSILSSVLKVEHHYHRDPRREGFRFKAQQTRIENGEPETKKGFARNRFGGKKGGMPYDVKQVRSHFQFEDKEDSSRNSPKQNQRSSGSYKGSYKREYDGRDIFENSYRQHNSYKSEPYSRRYKDYKQDDDYEKEYQRHKKNNNHHLAQHYYQKKSRR